MLQIEVNFEWLFRGETESVVASLKDPTLAARFEPGMRVLLYQPGYFEVEVELHPESGEWS